MLEDERWLLNPGHKLMALVVKEDGGLHHQFGYGAVAVALELMTQLRIFRVMEGSSLLALAREEIASVLETFLKQQGLWEETEAVYEALLAAERPLTFVADPVRTESS